jgi:hypothetical protein
LDPITVRVARGLADYASNGGIDSISSDSMVLPMLMSPAGTGWCRPGGGYQCRRDQVA